MNFSDILTKQIENSTIEWKYFILPSTDGHFKVAQNLKFIAFPLINFYYLYFMVKWVVKYKTKLEPVHIFEMNTMGDMLGCTTTKMIINYDPFLGKCWFYKCQLIHLLNIFSKQCLSFDMALGKKN